MAAMRSALAMVSRRSSGSQAAAPVSGRGVELHQVFRPPSLPLRPAAVHEGCRHFSTGVEGAAQCKPLLMKHKAESILRMWWQRSRDSVKNVTKDSTVVATTISFMASFCLLRSTIFSSADIRTKNVQIHHSNAFSKCDYIRTNAILESPLPISFSMIPSFQGIYISSLRPRRGHAVTSMKTKDRS
ncbi:unnamed protein product [Urochloa humidicola]